MRDFCIGFLVCSQKINLSAKSRDCLLEFIKSLFPFPHKIPRSYYQLTKILDIEQVQEKKVCSQCLKIVEISYENSECIASKHSKSSNFKTVEHIYTFNVTNQLINIIEREFDHFLNYKSKYSFYLIIFILKFLLEKPIYHFNFIY